MNRVYICLLLLLFQSISLVSAQVVSGSADRLVIDLSAFKPLECVLSSSEAKTRLAAMYAVDVNPSNSAPLSVGINISGNDGTWNAKMSTNYQMMKQDHTVGATDFANAWNTCKAYASEGGSKGTWRLPTQRELGMIWVLHPQLIQKGFAGFASPEYWSCTESETTKAR